MYKTKSLNIKKKQKEIISSMIRKKKKVYSLSTLNTKNGLNLYNILY